MTSVGPACGSPLLIFSIHVVSCLTLIDADYQTSSLSSSTAAGCHNPATSISKPISQPRRAAFTSSLNQPITQALSSSAWVHAARICRSLLVVEGNAVHGPSLNYAVIQVSPPAAWHAG